MLDIAKGLGIILVVFGHFVERGGAFNKYVYAVIYTFHMPLFFFISGFLYKPKSIKDTCSKIAKKYILPAYMFLLLDIVIQLYYGVAKEPNFGIRLLKTLLLTKGTTPQGFVINAPLWFLMSLSIILIFESLSQQNKRFGLIVLLTALMILLINQTTYNNAYIGLCWYLNWVLGYVFFKIGLFTRKHKNIVQLNNKKLLLIIAISEVIIILAVPFINGTMVIANFRFGKYIPLSAVTALFGIDFIFILSKTLEKHTGKISCFIKKCGIHSFTIMISHYIFSCIFEDKNIIVCTIGTLIFIIAEISLIDIYHKINEIKESKTNEK